MLEWFPISNPVMEIRNGRLDDAAEIARIFNFYVRTSDVIFSEHELSEEEMKRKLAPVAGHFPFLVAEEDGRLLGYCYAHPWQPDYVYRFTLELTEYLDHESLSKGLGTRMLQMVIDQCRAAGFHSVVSAVTGGTIPCERMHDKLGFRVVGVVKDSGFKFGRFLDDVFYQLIL